MPDASIRIDGRHVADAPKFGDANGTPVANLRVAAGRSRKNDQGGYDTLSQVFYDVAFWREHHDLIAGLNIGKGDSVVITGNVTSVETFQKQDGSTGVSVRVTGHGIQHFPKRDGQQGGGFGQPQQSYQPSPQGEGFGAQAGYQMPPQATPQQAPGAGQWGSGTGGGDAWPAAAQPGPGAQQGFDTPPF